MSNPLKPLADFYKEQTKKEDKKGYAKKYKLCSEIMFETLEKNCSIHISNIDYLDGYFIFSSGTNSVVHFYIDECPGWKFSVWWSPPEDYIDNNGKSVTPKFIRGTFFTQFESNIDKFKPNRSEISCLFTCLPDRKEQFNVCGSFWEVEKQIGFIKNEPALAFCRDYMGWDYNEEYHTRKEAEKEFEKYKKWFANKEKWSAVCDQKMLDYFETKVKPLFKHCKIVDFGDCVSPRFELQAPYKSNKDFFEGTGLFSCFEKDSKEEKEFRKIEEECKKISDKYEFYWFSPISDVISIYDNSKKKTE